MNIAWMCFRNVNVSSWTKAGTTATCTDTEERQEGALAGRLSIVGS